MAELYKKNLNKKDLLKRVGNASQIMGAQKIIFDDGIGKGTSGIRVRNGNGLDFTILPDKALDILDASLNSVPLAWIGKPGLVANKFFDDTGLGWLRSFGGGLLTTCGMRNAGPPVDDNNEHFGLHGRATSIPAEKVSIKEYWDKDEFIIEISGKIREAKTFGENLVINRTYMVSSKNNTIDIKDTIVNEGFSEEEYMLLYHINWGYPFFGPEADLKIDTKKTIVRGEDQSEVENWNKFTDPIHNFEEIVYFHELNPDNNGNTKYELINNFLGIAAKVSWNNDALDYLIQWKMTGEGEYVLGLEPSNNLAAGRKGERDAGRLKTLKPFEEKEINISIELNIY